jgi:hypothetical protein
MRTLTTINAILVSALFLLFINASVASADAKSSQTEIENTAKKYMTAFFRGDIRTAANFMHPETLNELRRSFLSELDNAKAAGQEDKFLAQMNVKKDGDTLRKLNSKELYVILVESDHKKNENGFQKMKETTVSVVSSKLLQTGEATVQLKITTPTENGTKTQDTGLLLAKAGGEWKVKGNSQ